MKFTNVIWLFPFAVLAHNLEESIWMPIFWRQHALQIPYTALEFRIAAVGLAFLAFWITYLAAKNGARSKSGILLFLYCGAMWLNAWWHVGVSIYFRGYAPGVVTAVLIILPVTSCLLLQGWRLKSAPGNAPIPADPIGK